LFEQILKRRKKGGKKKEEGGEGKRGGKERDRKRGHYVSIVTSPQGKVFIFC